MNKQQQSATAITQFILIIIAVGVIYLCFSTFKSSADNSRAVVDTSRFWR